MMDGAVNSAGGPTTRRAWQDWCKSSNNSNHDSQSEEEEGSLNLVILKKSSVLTHRSFRSKKGCQEKTW